MPGRGSFFRVANTLSVSTWKSPHPIPSSHWATTMLSLYTTGKAMLRTLAQYRDQGGTDGEDDSNHY